MSEKDVFAPCEDFVADFVGFVRNFGEGGDFGRDSWIRWRSPWPESERFFGLGLCCEKPELTPT